MLCIVWLDDKRLLFGEWMFIKYSSVIYFFSSGNIYRTSTPIISLNGSWNCSDSKNAPSMTSLALNILALAWCWISDLKWVCFFILIMIICGIGLLPKYLPLCDLRCHVMSACSQHLLIIMSIPFIIIMVIHTVRPNAKWLSLLLLLRLINIKTECLVEILQ